MATWVDKQQVFSSFLLARKELLHSTGANTGTCQGRDTGDNLDAVTEKLRQVGFFWDDIGSGKTRTWRLIPGPSRLVAVSTSLGCHIWC